MLDLLLKGGWVIDGLGTPMYRGGGNLRLGSDEAFAQYYNDLLVYV